MFEFALVYPDLRMGNYLSRDIGQTSAGNKVRKTKKNKKIEKTKGRYLKKIISIVKVEKEFIDIFIIYHQIYPVDFFRETMIQRHLAILNSQSAIF